MELIYQNGYGASYSTKNDYNTGYQLQLIIGSIGVFLSREDINDLQTVIEKSRAEGCNCDTCGEKTHNSIWKYTYLADVRLKIDYISIDLLEDLIKGTQFQLNMNTTLKQNQIY